MRRNVVLTGWYNGVIMLQLCYDYFTASNQIKASPILIHAYQTCFIFTIPRRADEGPTVAIKREQTGKPQQADVAYFGVQRVCLLCLLWQDFTPICFFLFLFFDAKHNANQDRQLPTMTFLLCGSSSEVFH